MKRIERILCPVDFSESSRFAYATALSLAQRFRAKLYLLHAFDFRLPFADYYAPSDFLAELLRKIRVDTAETLNAFARSQDAGRTAECIVRKGAAAETILDCAQTLSASEIIMGAHGFRGADRFVLGSAAEKVLRKAKCPVLLTRQPAHQAANAAISLRKVLFCTDFSDPARRALDYALAVAAEHDAEVELIHVVKEAKDAAATEKAVVQARAELEQLVPSELLKIARIKTAVRVGKAYEQIVRHISESGADLAIMASHGRDALDLAVFGSTTYRVIQLGACSVLVVRG